MHVALGLLADVFEAPAANAAMLDELRTRWRDLSPEERAALTPLAQLAARRVAAAQGGAGEHAGQGAAAAPAARAAASSPAAAPPGHAAASPPAAHAPTSPPAAHARTSPPAAHAPTSPPAAHAAASPSAGAPPANPAPSPPAGAPLDLAALAPAPRPPTRPRAPIDATPEALLSLVGLTDFRPGQRAAVQAALDGRDALVVMPTGGGKSLCYQLPALATTDLTVVVSPLIALMRDQCARLTDLGHPAVMLASGEDNQSALQQIRNGHAQVVFAAPERFASPAFRSALSARQLALFVVDEAHCVSEWGHDFRPDYLRLATVIGELGHPPTMACTATATPKVAEEIVTRLGLREPERVRSGFDRPNLSFDVLNFDGEGSVARKRATLAAGVEMPENRPAVVYCGTRKSTEEIAALLHAPAYHAGMSTDQRTQVQDAFMRGETDVVVATNAFGMGVDKADVRSVWHWALPSSLEAYYQEAGRAGRDGQPARAVLLASRSDLGRLVRFIQEAEVTVEQVASLVNRLRAQGDLELAANEERDRILLAVAERAGALTLSPGNSGRVHITLADRPLDRGRVSQLCYAAKDRRWQSYRSIEHYAAANDNCRRRQLLDHFGDHTPGAPLGRCCDVHDPPDWLPPITATKAKKKTAAAADDGPPVSDAELEPLKAWRRERADGKPAYTVATDATLREVIRRRPSSPDELLEIKGIGKSFLDKHADSLLELLAQ